jgi:catechol 2,3-dioxygenase-like lactoylglutathione lyase family enzyme
MASESPSIPGFFYRAMARHPKQLLKRLFAKSIALLLWVMLPVIMKGQSKVIDTSSFTASGAFFALSVNNLEESVKWYKEKLGLRVTRDIPEQNKSTVSILEGNGLIVELIRNRDARLLSEIAPTVTDKILIHGIFKTGAIVDNFDKMISMFKEQGVEIVVGPFPSRPGQRANVIIKDNSGNLIQFFGK